MPLQGGVLRLSEQREFGGAPNSMALACASMAVQATSSAAPPSPGCLALCGSWRDSDRLRQR
jgi:hypothetical protein